MLTNLVVADRTKRDLFETRDPDRQLRLMRLWTHSTVITARGRSISVISAGLSLNRLFGRISSADAIRRRGPSYGLSVDAGMGFDRRGETS